MYKIAILLFLALFSSSIYASQPQDDASKISTPEFVEVTEDENIIDLTQLEAETMNDVISIQATGEGASTTEIVIVTIVVAVVLLAAMSGSAPSLGY